MHDLGVDQLANLGVGQRADIAEMRLFELPFSFGLDHAAIANEDDFPDLEAGRQLADLRSKGGRIAGVAFEGLNTQRLAIAGAQQPDRDLLLARLAIAIVAVFAKLVLLTFEVRRGYVVQHQGGGLPGAFDIVAIQPLLDRLLLCRRPLQRLVQIVFIEPAQPQHGLYRMVPGPAYRREP